MKAEDFGGGIIIGMMWLLATGFMTGVLLPIVTDVYPVSEAVALPETVAFSGLMIVFAGFVGVRVHSRIEDSDEEDESVNRNEL